MRVLGLETSCDETGMAYLDIEGRWSARGLILKIGEILNFVASQVKIHAPYGGVVPSLAKREHQKNLKILFKKIKNEKIDLVSMTIGPGLEPCLWQGINFAKEISKKLKVPILGINHLEGHILINFLRKKEIPNLFPALGLVVSGGHTELFLIKEFSRYQFLGGTRDDAAGECLDKVARLLNLGYPGGPKIEKLARFPLKEKKFHLKFPRPMIFQKNYDFSFAGLKTAVFYDFLKRKEKERNSREYKIEVAKEVENAIIEVLIEKTLRAAKEYKVKAILTGGGVMANQNLKKKLKERVKKELNNVEIFLPKKEDAIDNGLMIAFSGFLHYLFGEMMEKKIEARPNLRIDEKIYKMKKIYGS